MSRKQLYVVSSDAEAAPSDLRALLASLREFGLVGEEFDFYGDTQYRPGAEFSQSFAI